MLKGGVKHIRKNRYEADISAEKAPSYEATWVSGAYEYARRSERVAEPSTEGSKEAFRLGRGFMLHRSLRLKDTLSFQKAFRFGKPFLFGNIGCKVLFSCNDGRKFGFIAPKKMFRLAVDRNTARRLLSEAAVSYLGLFPENASIVLFFRRAPASMELKSIDKDIRGLVEIISASVKRKGQ